MYNTLLGVDVPVDLMARLDEMARDQRITRSMLVRSALAAFAGVDIHSHGNGNHNRDGREADALGIIRQHPKSTVAELVEILKAADCKRGKNWVADHKRELFAMGSTLTAERELKNGQVWSKSIGS